MINLISTSRFARLNNIEPSYLFKVLLDHDYIQKVNGRYFLTSLGMAKGGHYLTTDTGEKYIGWPRNLVIPTEEKTSLNDDITSILRSIIQYKDKFANLFDKYSVKERSEDPDVQNRISELKRQIRILESQCVAFIVKNKLKVEDVVEFLGGKRYSDFLNQNPYIESYREYNDFNNFVGLVEKSSDDFEAKTNEFKTLCYTILEDGVVSKEEIEILKTYCIDNRIDQQTSYLIRKQIFTELRDKLDIEEILRYHSEIERMDRDEILKILEKQYFLEITEEIIDRLRSVDQINVIEKVEECEKEILVNENKYQLFVVPKDHIRSGYMFDVGPKHKQNEADRIYISKELFESCSDLEISDIMVDAIVYLQLSRNSDPINGIVKIDVRKFLELKKLVKIVLSNS